MTGRLSLQVEVVRLSSQLEIVGQNPDRIQQGWLLEVR